MRAQFAVDEDAWPPSQARHVILLLPVHYQDPQTFDYKQVQLTELLDSVKSSINI